MSEIIDNRKRSIQCYSDSGKAKYGEVSRCTETYGRSRKTLWKYNMRFRESAGDEMSLLPQKRGPKNGSNRILKHVERTIVSIHRKLNWKGVLIWAELKSRGFVNPDTGKPVSKATVYNVLDRYPTFETVPEELVQRYEKPLPGDLGHVDLKKAKNVAGEDPKVKKYYSQLLDDCTRAMWNCCRTRKQKRSPNSCNGRPTGSGNTTASGSRQF